MTASAIAIDVGFAHMGVAVIDLPTEPNADISIRRCVLLETKKDPRKQRLVRDDLATRACALGHAFATWAADAGATSIQLQALMGWRSVAMSDRYVHRERLDLGALVQRMGQGRGNLAVGSTWVVRG